ncbi:MAG: hypothetical protein IT258_17500 [Saprospiraceae bacterium]|nr:hypothetical protein [Saprospiraceae bacterium]
MKFNLICRMSAMCSIAFFMAISFTAFGQKTVQLANTRFNQLLTTGEAAPLRAKLLKLPGATLGRRGVSETHSGTYNRKPTTVEIASQFINTRDGELEQVTIQVNEGGQATTISLVQYPEGGGLGRIINDIVQPLEQAGINYEACLFGSENNPASCEKCLDQITECVNPNVALASSCMVARLLNPVGACVRCGVLSLAQVLTCFFSI